MNKAIDHIGIVVRNIEEEAKRYKELVGIELVHTAVHEAFDVKVGFLDCGNTEIELLEPLSTEGGIGRYLEKRGPGLHHICFETEDIEAHLERLKKDGVELIDQKARDGAVGDVAFLHPKAGGGTLIELNQITKSLPWRAHRR